MYTEQMACLVQTAVIVGAIIIVLYFMLPKSCDTYECYQRQQDSKKLGGLFGLLEGLTKYTEGFSLSKKPLEQDWSLLHMNPFDNIDYQTPVFAVNKWRYY